MTPHEELTDADYTALADLRYALRQFQAFSEGRAAAVGLTPQQHQALLAIRGASPGPADIGYVADRLILKPHSATGLINRLEAMGLVMRRASRDDRRHALLELTPKAQVLLGRLSATHREEIVRLEPTLKRALGHLA
ncbi:MAG: MarR family transcriptional regulator [Pseudomonadota bacterium]|nr:MarR family transcriptional regulator [Pseudomonadota bacterium]